MIAPSSLCRMRPSARLLLCVICFGAAGVACGGHSAKATTSEVTAVEEAVRSYSSAFLRGDGDAAFAMLSARCQTVLPKAQLTAAARGGAALYGRARIVSIQPTLAGNRATVTYRFDQPAIDQTNQPWAREGGAWRYDSC